MKWLRRHQVPIGKFDLVVQKSPKDSEFENGLPEDLGASISKIPHVAAVAPGLMDVVSFEERKVSAAFVFGWPADSPLMQDLNIKSGRRFRITIVTW